MLALNRKLLRDLWAVKGQVLAIALVIGAGLGVFVMYMSTFDSLRFTQTTYYDQYRFGDVFASLKRAPRRLGERIRAIPGVARAETRVVVGVNLDVPGLSEPAVGRLVSIPEDRRPALNDLFLRRGRYIRPQRPDEVVVSEGFALAHQLDPGDTVTAILNGRRRELSVVGIGLSPEYIYTIRPGEFIPDDARYGVFWIGREALATAYDMEGGFNDLSVTLAHGASESDVIGRLDRLLEPYGALGAIPRSLQLSNWYLDSELTQMQTVGLIVPLIFLGVAAFLLNVVLTRMIAVQREQIAALKALGYSNRQIAWHYTLWSLTTCLLGAVIGVVLGGWMGSGVTAMYNDYFKFPILHYQLSGGLIVGAIAFALVAGLLGAFSSVRSAVRLPPAEAMRPEAPAVFHRGLLERVGFAGLLSPPVKMILRNLERRPGRTATSILGIGFGLAMLVVGTFFLDALDVLVDVQFSVAQRQDMTVAFTEPASARALHEIARLPGVVSSEPQRVVAARLRAGHRSRQVAITGLPAEPRLNRIVRSSLAPVRLPPEGLVLNEKLAEILGVQRGDEILIEILEGVRPVRRVVVAELVDEYLGTAAYMEIGALRRMMREGRVLSGAFIQVDSRLAERLHARLKGTPGIAGVNVKRAAIEAFTKTLDETMGLFVSVNILFSAIIAFGVVYNAARVSLSERSRDLASLRVLGFTRGEIAFILLGELAVVTLLAIPVGMFIGWALAWLTVAGTSTELYRFPLVILPRTYTLAAVTVIVASTLSGLVVRRKLNHLDLIGVLKTRA